MVADVGDAVVVFGSTRQMNVAAHAILEFFCAVIALLIAGLLYALARRQQQPLSMTLFALAFASMGLLDLLHAASSPVFHLSAFVLFHTLSVVSGAIFMFLGIAAHFLRRTTLSISAILLRAVGFLGIFVATVGILYATVPTLWPHDIYSFTVLARRSHELAGFLYLVTAIGVFVDGRMHRNVISYVLAGNLLVFATSAFLYSFSYLWDAAWWTWHAIRALFSIVILLIVIIQFIRTMGVVERTGRSLARANTDLHTAYDSLRLLNARLHARNEMVRSAISSFSLKDKLAIVARALEAYVDKVCYRVVLFAAPDEVDESRRLLDREGLPNSVTIVTDPRFVVASTALPTVVADGGVKHEAVAGLRLALRSNDTSFGYVDLDIGAENALRIEREPLVDLGAEISPIIYNALLSLRSVDSDRFRSGLLRLSSALRSTLELDRTIALVGEHTPDLLDSDAAFVLLGRGPGDLAIVGMPAGIAEGQVPAGFQTWLRGGLGLDLLEELWRARRPIDCARTDAGAEHPTRSSYCCDWGAIALFPLVDHDEIGGVIAVLRRHAVRFSRATLEKGELVADQVRLALENVRTYEELRRTNDRLRNAERRKSAAERLAMIGEMAATVAHEIRNPLGAIVNCVTVLRGSAGRDHQAKAALEIIDDEARRLERLATSFLNFGKRPLAAPRLRMVSLETVVRQVCVAVQGAIAERRQPVTLHHCVRGDARPVRFPEDGLREVIWNLALNAVQAIDHAGTVTVDLRMRTAHVFVAVSDTGRGIEPSQREQIFEPFFTMRSQGAGLGLAIVRKLVASWSGRIRVMGGPGRGTCFAVLVPIPADDEAWSLPIERKAS
ncbi:ATP-binding protein [Rhodoplanes serenus]|uniref:ATP-binding protein n=1 Tax=Rhodoplanes serenus TaxID=200615 RepID=UPI000DAD28FD|nr:ATP-binding protein [Rhodoplanes serenus]RAI35070.1 hypothetical protein CH340_07115 [Rhodoplanes serenus]